VNSVTGTRAWAFPKGAAADDTPLAGAAADSSRRIASATPGERHYVKATPCAGQCARLIQWRLVLIFAVAGLFAKSPPADAAITSGKTAFVYGDIYLKHKTGAGHPERPERLTAIVDRLKQKGLLDEVVAIKPVAASTEWLTAIHTPDYIEHVKQSCRSGTRYLDSADTPISADSYDAALAAAGGVLAAVDAVMDGKASNALCAVRPPGHHALEDRAMGFCLFNNVAIAARYVQKKHKLARVLIVDWDVHHGNGTQAAFYDDPSVFYFSVHQSPFYPGTGSAEERGEGKGVGVTLNVPLRAGGGDSEYQRAFEEKLIPAATAFKPDFGLISSGFDAARGDLLGGMKITPEGYAALSRIVKSMATDHCQGRLVSVLEGGYNVEAVAASVEAHLRILME